MERMPSADRPICLRWPSLVVIHRAVSHAIASFLVDGYGCAGDGRYCTDDRTRCAGESLFPFGLAGVPGRCARIAAGR